MFYLYDYDLEDANYLILDSALHSFFEKDLEIIKSDWNIIHQKILEGKADEISESDTMYLGACPKGDDSLSNYREQPFSKVKARQRAYCLKSSYMNAFINKIFENKTYEEIVSYNEIKEDSFENIIKKRLSRYFGKSESVLLKEFNVSNRSNAKFNLLCGKMLGIKGRINSSDEFVKANICLKTIRLEENGEIKQHMSFPYFYYKEIVNQEWEDSDIYKLLSSSKFLFVIFQKRNYEYVLDKVVLWNMPYNDLEKYVKPVFENTKKVISEGNIVQDIKNGKFKTNFLGSTYNRVCHVRPHDGKGINKTKKGFELPVQDKLTHLTRYTKQCFWLDRSYIKKIILK